MWRQEDHEFEASLGQMVNWKPAELRSKTLSPKQNKPLSRESDIIINSRTQISDCSLLKCPLPYLPKYWVDRLYYWAWVFWGVLNLEPHTKQTLYHLSHASSPALFAFRLFFRQGLLLGAGLQLQSCPYLPHTLGDRCTPPQPTFLLRWGLANLCSS
jgi:hypothetical protein